MINKETKLYELLEFNNFEQDYLKWAKIYSISKLHEFDHSKIKDNFDVIELEEKLNESCNIEELHTINNLINRRGIKQMATLSMALKRFFIHIKGKVNSFDELNSDFIGVFVNKHCMDMGLKYGIRNNYKKNLVAFLTEIGKTNKNNFKFPLEKIEVISNADDKKKPSELLDWLDSNMIREFLKKIVSYPYQNDFVKNRDILIARLFICSGIEINEIKTLTIKSFFFNSNEMNIKIVKPNGKERIVPLPKPLFIRYYNQYLKIRENKTDLFFYDEVDNSKPIDTKTLKLIVDRLLEFSKINVRQKTPKMLRKSYIVFIHNEPDENGFTQPLKNVQELSGIENVSDLKEILRYGTIDVVTASDSFVKLLK